MSSRTEEIPIYPVNQVPAKTAGPVGRLTDIQNMDVEHYTPSNRGTHRIKLSQRHGFDSLSTNTHDPSSGAPNSLSWSNPEILSALGKQPVSVCNSIPRVFSGESFTGYSDKRVCTSKFTQSVFHTSDSTIQVSDDAWIGGVTCSVWTETTLKNGVPVTVSKIGFKGDNEAWIIAPKILKDFGTDVTSNVSMARVCADGDGERFWVVYNSFDSVRVLAIKVYDTDGELLGSAELTQNAANPGPGFWDIAPRPQGGIMIVQPGAEPSGSTDVHVQTTKATYAAGVVTLTSVTDTSIRCSGQVAIVSNEFDTKTYIGTWWQGAASGFFLRGYQVDNSTLLNLHEFAYTVTTATPVDSIIGWVEDSGIANQPNLTLGYTSLPTVAATDGPGFDPALRYSRVYVQTWAGSGQALLRQVNSLCFVSRAFKHDGEWYAIMYYQSGSGLTITGQTISVDIAGAHMIGAPIQPISVSPGDFTEGSVKTFVNPRAVEITTPIAAANIDDTGTADKVELVTLSGDPLLPDGMEVAKWTFKNLTNLPVTNGGRLHVHASSIASANDDWQFIYAPSSHVFYTLSVSEFGNPIVPGTFVGSGGGGGTVSMVSMALYENLSDQILFIGNVYNSETVKFLAGSALVTSGFSAPGNNGTFTIVKVNSQTIVPGVLGLGEGIRVVKTTQSSELSMASLEVHPLQEQLWSFANGFKFSAVLSSVAHHLVVEDSTFNLNGNIIDNDGEYIIDTVSTAHELTTDGSNIFAQIFNSVPPDVIPSISVVLPLDVTAYEFSFPALTISYELIGAIINVAGAQNDSNNGNYKITGIDPTNNIIFTESADGRTDQFSESFTAGAVVTIILTDAIKPVFQPKWFMTPLKTGLTTAHVGRFDDGLAYADWRIEGDPTLPANMFSMGVTSVPARTLGKQFVLPYRAKSFTSGQPLVSPQGQVLSDAAQTLFESSVGLKTFILDNSPAFPFEATNEVLLSGPLTSVFTQSGFNEQGINVAPENPFVVSQGVVESGTFITPGTTHQYQVAYRFTLENGDTVLSPPSPPLDVKLIGTSNKNVIGGRLPISLDSSGIPVAKHFGLTNYRILGIIITRTSYRNNTPTIQHFEITDPLNPNALAVISSVNTSGFSFPDEFTWHYTDANPDVDILESEILYTDKGYLPRFPARPSRGGCIWRGRQFTACDDGSVQMSGEKTEGDDYWFFPGFRWTFGNDKAVNCQPMGNYLIVGCERSFWYIPAPGAFPDSGGRNGSMPSAVEIEKVTHGCLGPMSQISGGVAYASTVGGIWAINSNFESVWISIGYKDDLNLKADNVYALAVDRAQRLYCVTNTPNAYVYDQIANVWMKYVLPSINNTLLAIVDGIVHYQDNHRVFRLDNSTFADNIDGTLFCVNWKLVFAYLSFGPVRAYKFCREFQLLGEYKGDHREKVTLSYPEQKWQPDTVFGPTAVDPTTDFLVAFNPAIEDASVFGLTIEADFVGVSVPGNSAEIELLSAEIGLSDSGMLQTTRRLT